MSTWKRLVRRTYSPALAAAGTLFLLLTLLSFCASDTLLLSRSEASFQAQSSNGFLEFTWFRSHYIDPEPPRFSHTNTSLLPALHECFDRTLFGATFRSAGNTVACDLLGFHFDHTGTSQRASTSLRIPTWTLPAAAFLLAYRARHRRAKSPHPTCPHCGYDTRANTTRCSECGASLPSTAS